MLDGRKECLYGPEEMPEFQEKGLSRLINRGERVKFKDFFKPIRYSNDREFVNGWVGGFVGLDGSFKDENIFLPPNTTLVHTNEYDPNKPLFKQETSYVLMFNGNFPRYKSNGSRGPHLILPDLEDKKLYTPKYHQGIMFVRKKGTRETYLPTHRDEFIIKSLPREYLEIRETLF